VGSEKVLASLKTMKIPASVMDVLDDSFIDLEYEKNLTKIDYDKMKSSVKETHATKGNGDFYDCKEVCYKFKPGQHYLLKSSEHSELTKFGVGILLYFKFIKQLILYFGLFCLISIPAYIFYIAAFVQYSPSTNSVSYLDLLTATTLGSVGMCKPFFLSLLLTNLLNSCFLLWSSRISRWIKIY